MPAETAPLAFLALENGRTWAIGAGSLAEAVSVAGNGPSVAPVPWSALRQACITTHYVPEGDHERILAAFNEKFDI